MGASRGIGRQVAIDMAKNGYAGKHLPHTPHLGTLHANIEQLKTNNTPSNASRENYF